MTDPERDSRLPVQRGDVIAGRFRVDSVLGEGGMGIVVGATHLGLGHRVAIKLMLGASPRHAEAVARFEREARAAVKLKSEHVARVTDVGRLEDGAPFMVMEFLEGDDLDAVLVRDGALPIALAADYVLQACEAVAEAHALGIVHRDLKPKNLFLTTGVNAKPLVKVLDFGISKAGGHDELSLTSTSAVMGSPNYMSPEQLRSSRDVDARSDVWALGVVLYELLSGRVPFPADTVTQLTVMVIQDAPMGLRSLRADVPEALERVVLKCLEKRREDRYESVAALAQALSAFASPEAAAAAAHMASGAAMSSATTAPLRERVSVRVLSSASSSTDVAWDKTEFAPSGSAARAPRDWRHVALAGVAAAAVAAAAFVALRHVTTTPPHAASTGALVSPGGSPPTVAPLPTAREPINAPPVAASGDSERPPPPGFAPATSASAAAAKPTAPLAPIDAGKPKPVLKATSDDLPSERN